MPPQAFHPSVELRLPCPGAFRRLVRLLPTMNTPGQSQHAGGSTETPPRSLPRLLRKQGRKRERAGGFLAGLRIRKKLLFLHTVFSLALAGVLLLSVRPALNEVVYRAELDEAQLLLETLAHAAQNDPSLTAQDLTRLAGSTGKTIRFGTADELGLSSDLAAKASVASPSPVEVASGSTPQALTYIPALRGATGGFVLCQGAIPEARQAVFWLYVLVSIALLAVYAMVVVALELFILPQHVYAPIRKMLSADRAVRDGRADEELIDPREIPADELGEIMQSRNAAIVLLREHQRKLAQAIEELNTNAMDLRRKNHLLETAQKNLADADRLASLGMMSAGIAHELNTPLAVLKGLVERLARDPERGVDVPTAALMARVVGRLEHLGESLLDFARVRPPRSAPVTLRFVVEEAVTLVKLDRAAPDIQIDDSIDPSLVVECDATRMVQVFVNLVRNCVDAVRSDRGAGRSGGLIEILAEGRVRDGVPWVSVTVRDNGPGIDPAVLARLFEPFVSTRLDSKGTGLGLAVSEGIVREHGGVIFARNRVDQQGAEFEVMLPLRAGETAGSVPEGATL